MLCSLYLTGSIYETWNVGTLSWKTHTHTYGYTQTDTRIKCALLVCRMDERSFFTRPRLKGRLAFEMIQPREFREFQSNFSYISAFLQRSAASICSSASPTPSHLYLFQGPPRPGPFMLIAVASAGDSKGTNTKDNMKSLEKKKEKTRNYFTEFPWFSSYTWESFIKRSCLSFYWWKAWKI